MTIQSTGNNGLFWRALAISGATHALLLAAGSPSPPIERATTALHGTLRPSAAHDSAAVAPAIPGLARPRLEVAATGLRHAARPDSRGAPAVTRTMAALAPLPWVTPAAGPSTALAEGQLPVAAGSPVRAESAPARADPRPVLAADADGLRQYRLSLAREARTFKRYPERARLEGAGGTAEVRIEQEAGSSPLARLMRSSGHAALDTAALEMMRQAAARTVVPESLRGRHIVVSLPVVFDLDSD